MISSVTYLGQPTVRRDRRGGSEATSGHTGEVRTLVTAIPGWSAGRARLTLNQD